MEALASIGIIAYISISVAAMVEARMMGANWNKAILFAAIWPYYHISGSRFKP